MNLLTRRLGLALTALVFFVNTVQAQENKTAEKCETEDITALFCEKMADEDLYEKHKFDSYKMLVAGKEGWIFRSQSDLKTDFTLKRETLDKLEEMSRAYRQNGIELVMLVTPTRGMIHARYLNDSDRKKYGFENAEAVWKNYEAMLENLRKRGIHVVPPPKPGAADAFFYKRDHHWNPQGARMAAQAVAAYVKKMPAYQNVEKISYVTKNAGNYEFYGVSKKVFKKLCNTTQPPERIQKQLTERANTAQNDDALFGETKEPSIILLGTSNSTMEPSYANFEGFLKEELSADVLNMSVSGGGIDTAMISYLGSDFYNGKPGRIAVWEMPAYYDLNNEMNFFREAVPAVYGSCGVRAIARADSIKIADKTFTALGNLSGKKVTGKDYYVDIRFDSPLTEAFYLDLRYIKNRDRYRFYRPARYPKDRQFFAELRDDKPAHLDKIVLTVPQEAVGREVSVALCKKSGQSFVVSTDESGEPNEETGVNGLFEKMKSAIKL